MIVADWVKIVISGVVGFLLARLGDILKTKGTEKDKKRKMRKALYVEIIQHYRSFKIMLEIVAGTRPHVEELVEKRLKEVDLQGSRCCRNQSRHSGRYIQRNRTVFVRGSDSFASTSIPCYN